MQSVKYQKPSKWLQATEGVRTAQDFQTYLFWQHLFLNKTKLPKNTPPIIVVPGFLSSDDSTFILRSVLEHLGANVQGWDLETNFGVRLSLIDGLAKLIVKVSHETTQKVILVGHSLGGVYAKELAKMFPALVEHVISLGSPLFDIEGDSSSISEIYKIFNPLKASGDMLPIERTFKDNFDQLPPCPVTSIYSKADGIVQWQASLLPEGKLTQNIEVDCSHCGMAISPAVIHLLTRLVEQPAGDKLCPSMVEKLFVKDY
jgi:pimeloyl-ACP methyl ester carboxylesterase